MAKMKTTITIDEELYEKLKEVAGKEERSVSQQITYFIKIGIEQSQEVSRE
jgi:predicted CopG family antitoxin